MRHSNGKVMIPEGISLYIHIPFCKTKCPYCDFNTYQGIESLIKPYAEALSVEVRLWGTSLSHPKVNTIFFGGGTPSYIPLDLMDKLLSSVRDSFETVASAEITIEANPGDLNIQGLLQLLKMGVNRLSIGVQSLDDSLLTMLGRRHTADEAVEAYDLARQAGFQRVNLDFMYGLPNQTVEQWEDTMTRVLELAPPHLSLYGLTLEKGTPLERWVKEGALPQPDPDIAADMYSIARESLEEAGYTHYEISNWEMPGQRSLHNMAYWLNQPYLGVGPGAHSHLCGHRFWDVSPPRLYIQRVQAWASKGAAPIETLDHETLKSISPVEDSETIVPDLEMAETMFLGLRLLEGISIEEFKHRFSVDPLELYGPQIKELQEEGLLEQADGRLRLTTKGLFLSNQVFMRFL